MTSFEKRENNRENWVGETKTGHMNHKTKKVGGATPMSKDSKWKIDLIVYGLPGTPSTPWGFYAAMFL